MNFRFLFISIALFLVLEVATKISAITFDEDSLAEELLRQGIPKSELPDWICLVKYESSFTTSAIGKRNKNGTRDWGLFQINDRWWCQNSDGDKSYNECKILCDDLLTDDITKAVKCARLIKKRQGFKAWVAWNKHCQDVHSRELDNIEQINNMAQTSNMAQIDAIAQIPNLAQDSHFDHLF